jgi:hypothetical protein
VVANPQVFQTKCGEAVAEPVEQERRQSILLRTLSTRPAVGS